MAWWGKLYWGILCSKLGGLWILEGTMFDVFVSFKVFMNQEIPSKKCFQSFIKNTSKRFLEKMNFRVTLPKMYFYNNSPNSFFKCPHNNTFKTVTFVVLLLLGTCFEDLFWNFQWKSLWCSMKLEIYFLIIFLQPFLNKLWKRFRI